ncbi:MAG: PAS domain S-box protein, partial [Opitutae bacterium]
MEGIGIEVINAIPDGLILVDEAAQIVAANKIAANLLGYQEDELIGQSIETIVQKNSGTSIEHIRQSFTQPDLMMVGEWRALNTLRKDGSQFPSEIALIPINSEDSKPSITACTIRDNTSNIQNEIELVKKQAEVQVNEERFRTLYDGSADAIVIHGEESIVDCNCAALKLFQVESKDDFCNLKLEQICPEIQSSGSNKANSLKYHIEQATLHENTRFDWEFQSLDGTRFPCEVSMTSILLD